MCLYCCKYVSKADNLLKEATSIILENTEAKRIQQRQNIIAMWHKSASVSLQYPSVLDPSRQDSTRVALRLLQNVLNRTSGLQELSSHQLAAQALSIPSSYSSDTFVFIYVSAAMGTVDANYSGASADRLRKVPHEIEAWLVATFGTKPAWAVLAFLPVDDPSLASEPNVDHQSYAPRTLLKTDLDLISVDQLRDYYWRPRVLWPYGLDEFVAVFVRKRKHKIEEDNSNDEDRYCIPGDNLSLDGTGKYEFDPSYEGHRCFYLQLRSLHVTSILTSKSPTIAGLKTTKGQRRFALFYAALLVPFWPPSDDGTPIRVDGYLSAENYCTYEPFCNLMAQWSDPSAAFIHRCRYYKLHNLCHSLATDTSVRKLLHAQKTQYVQRWSAMNPVDPPNQLSASDHPTSNDDDGDASHQSDFLLDFHTSRVSNTALHRREHLDRIQKTLYGLYSRPGSVCPLVDKSTDRGCEWGDAWSTATSVNHLQDQLVRLKQPVQTTASLTTCDPDSMRASFGKVTASVAVDGGGWLIPLSCPGVVITPTTPLPISLNTRGHYPTKTPSVFYAGPGFVQAFNTSNTVLASGSTSGTVCNDLLAFWTRAPPNTLHLPAVVTAYRLLHSLLDPRTPVVARSRGNAILRDTLNDQQKQFSDRVVDNVLAGTPTYHLLCGGAGAGKSYVVGNIEHRLSELGVRCRAVSFQWRYSPFSLSTVPFTIRHRHTSCFLPPLLLCVFTAPSLK